MSPKWLVGLSAIALSATLAPSARATLALDLTSGATTIQVIDNGVGDVNPAVGAVTYVGGVGNFTVNVSTGLGYPVLGSPAIPTIDLNSVNATAGAPGSSLTISLSQTGFTSNGAIAFTGDIGGTLSFPGTLSSEYFIDLGDGLFATTDQIGSTLSFTSLPTAFSGSTSEVMLTDGSYSLTERVSLTIGGDGDVSFDSRLSAVAVPEPGSMAMLGAALLGFGYLQRRRRRHNSA